MEEEKQEPKLRVVQQPSYEIIKKQCSHCGHWNAIRYLNVVSIKNCKLVCENCGRFHK